MQRDQADKSGIPREMATVAHQVISLSYFQGYGADPEADGKFLYWQPSIFQINEVLSVKFWA